MRVLTVSAFYDTHGGGIELVAGATARAIAAQGHDCRWAASDFDRPREGEIVVPVPLKAIDPLERWAGLPMPVPSRSARQALEREVANADAVIMHDALYLTSVLAARYAARHGKPWLLVQHIGSIPYKNPVLRLALAIANSCVTRVLLARADQVVFISDTVRRFFSSVRYKRNPALLFNGVNHELFKDQGSKRREQLRSEFRMRQDRLQLLFVGRFVEKKGLSVLRQVAMDRPDWDLHLVGSGPVRPQAWGLPNLRLLGRKTPEELAALYNAADALILPSVGEGFPLVVQEAMACGLPVFCGMDSATADPGASPFVRGVEVDPANAELTASRFGEAIGQADLERDPALGRYAAATYDWDRNAEWLLSRITEIKRDHEAGSPRGRLLPAA